MQLKTWEATLMENQFASNKMPPAETIVICDGLTNGFVNPDTKYTSGKLHVGRDEAHRLMGKGRDLGKGPLPSFLQAADGARKRGGRIHLIFLQPLHPNDSPGENVWSRDDFREFPEPLMRIADESVVIKSPSNEIPWREINAAIEALTHSTFPLDDSDRSRIKFLVTGCHTEGRPLAIATCLRNVLCFKNVAVSMHLVGSSTREAHLATLRHTLSHHRVNVILDLEETARYAAIDSGNLSRLRMHPCIIEPEGVRDSLDANQRRIVELICMHWTRSYLKPLSGGFSGSVLLLAKGWKGDSRTEPMVLKIDAFSAMGREISGYHQVKDFLGKHIPNFDYPITIGDQTGVGMELATMDGQPETLQELFEKADVENDFVRFSRLFQKTLGIISERLYSNTMQPAVVIPYHQFGLNTDSQIRYLKQNAAVIESYLKAAKGVSVPIDTESLPRILKLIASNEDGVQSKICTVHGDLNYQNIICDEADNIWFIDWTHCGRYPLELDFAKLECDVKFVMSKEFDMEDLPHIAQFEKFLLANRTLPDAQGLPDHLKFAKWDFRYRKILATVRAIRDVCFAIETSDDWLVYRIALLRYALHTLSFDKQRGRGECEPYQLAHALVSVQQLMLDLISDDYHMRIRGERPPSYPPRQRLLIDKSPWSIKCPEYAPPFHVDPSVLENDVTRNPAGWSDPEDWDRVTQTDDDRTVRYDSMPPLHPRGRTGIAGRGLLGRWGANPAVNAVMIRIGPDSKSIELLLGQHEAGQFLWLPKGFVPPHTAADNAVEQVVRRKFGFLPESGLGEVIFNGFSYDSRQTDNAWVELTAYLFVFSSENAPTRFNSDREFENVGWWPVGPKTMKKLHPEQIEFVKIGIDHLETEGLIDRSDSFPLLLEDELE